LESGNCPDAPVDNSAEGDNDTAPDNTEGGNDTAPDNTAPTAAPTAPPTAMPTAPLDPLAPTVTPTIAPTMMERLDNAVCDVAASALRSLDTLKSISNITDGGVFQTCDGTPDTAGAWYTIEAGSVPEGEVIQASTCFAETNTMNTISVFRGKNCSVLECVDTDIIPCKNGALGHVVYWKPLSRESYFLFAHSADLMLESDLLSTFSDGAVFLEAQSFPPIANDDCKGAIEAPTDGSEVMVGSTKGARPEWMEKSRTNCGVQSAGVWYKVIGTGSSLKATTCSPGTNHPTQLHVFSGDCDDGLTCISTEANNHAVCDDWLMATNSATVNWETEAGVEYFILVGSRTGTVGSFELKISEFDPILNDQCSAALDTELNALEPYKGSTVEATNDFSYGEFCGSPLDTAGVWYTVDGTGKGISASTCTSSLASYNAAISIFTGSDCKALECLTGSAIADPACTWGGVTAAWLSEEGQTYHIYVHGSALNAYGDFELGVTGFEIDEENGFCNEAFPVMETGEIATIQGSTTNGTHSAPTDYCGAHMTEKGLWYTFNGTGFPFEIDACSSNSTTENGGVDGDLFDVAVSVYSGESCGELSCVSGKVFSGQICSNSILTRNLKDSDATMPHSLQSKENVTYYILVHGQINKNSLGVGDFELTIRSVGDQLSATPGDILVPTIAPNVIDPFDLGTSEPTNVNGAGGGSGAIPENEVKESKKSNSWLKYLWLILILLLIPLLYIFRDRLPCLSDSKRFFPCLSGSSKGKNNDENPSNGTPDEEASFDDEVLSKTRYTNNFDSSEESSSDEDDSSSDGDDSSSDEEASSSKEDDDSSESGDDSSESGDDSSESGDDSSEASQSFDWGKR